MHALSMGLPRKQLIWTVTASLLASICLYVIYYLSTGRPSGPKQVLIPIKSIDKREIYSLDGGGVRHLVPDLKTFSLMGFEAKDVFTLSDKEMQNYPLGAPVHTLKTTIDLPSTCPCSNSEEQGASSNWSAGKQICLLRTTQAIKILPNSLPEQFTWLPYHYHSLFWQGSGFPGDLAHCLAVFDIVGAGHGKEVKHVCPEQCLPVPYTILPISWLNTKHLDIHLPLTCSLTLAQLSRSMYNATSTMSPWTMLRIIAERRFQECNEFSLWSSMQQLKPRFVHGLLIWVGTTSKQRLLLDQISILKHQTDLSPSQITVGWMATEAQYGCKPNTTLCPIEGIYYHTAMPCTFMSYDTQHPLPAGWACAQRRPLRALAHVLHLYSPNFILLVDDDTYVSPSVLFSDSFKQFSHTVLLTSDAVYGEMQSEHMTRLGFYFGGAGYLFGMMVIDRLRNNQLLGPDELFNDNISPLQMKALSLLYEVIARSSKHCPGHCYANVGSAYKGRVKKSAIERNPYRYLYLRASLTMRVVDLCVQMMSHENTCYHSDHVVSRCLLYGIFAKPYHLPCNGSIDGNVVKMGMCFGTPFCDPRLHLTCHRYKVNPSSATKEPILILRKLL